MKIIILLLALQAQVANARWLTEKESGSVIEKFFIDYDVYKNGSWSQTIEFVTRVQSEDAKANSGLYPIEYNAFTDQVEILEAYTLNGKEKIKVEPAAIEDRDKGEAKDYDVQKVRSVVFPQVQIGSRLFIKYRIRTNKPLIEDRWSGGMLLGPAYHIEKFRWNVRSEVPISYSVRDPLKIFSVNQTSPKTIEVKNAKVIPGWVHAEKDPVFEPDRSSEIQMTTHKDWNEFFKSLSAQYKQILGQELPKDLAAWVKLAAKEKTNADKINFLMEKLSKDFRYFGDWRRHNGGFVPRPLAEISKSRYGDCKDLSTLLSAMLRGLKLDARVALVRRGIDAWGPERDYPLAGMGYFNHAIVRVLDGENEYWLDPTNPVASLKPYPDISGRPTYLLGEPGKITRLPAGSPDDFEHLHNYEYRFNADGSVRVRVKAQMKRMAPYQLANDMMLSPRTDVLSQTLTFFSEGQELMSHKYLTEPTTGRLLKDINIDLEYNAGRVTLTAGKSSFFVLPDGFLQGAFYETDERESDIQLGTEPYTFKRVRRLVDTRLAVEAPEPCAVDSEWMSITRRTEVEGKDVLITQDIRLKKPYIRHAEFKTPAFQKLQEDTKRCFYRSGLLIEPAVR